MNKQEKILIQVKKTINSLIDNAIDCNIVYKQAIEDAHHEYGRLARLNQRVHETNIQIEAYRTILDYIEFLEKKDEK